MAKRKDQIKLGAFLLFTGHHVAAWRHPQASVGTEFENYFQLARLAESAKFDAIFFADSVAARLNDLDAASRKAHSGIYPFEPITLLSALSSVTRNIGLVATASTTPVRIPRSPERRTCSLESRHFSISGCSVQLRP